MRKQGLPMVPEPDNNGRTQRSAHLCRKQVSPLIQSLLYTTSLLQDLHYYLSLLTERNLKRIFASSIQHLFCRELLQTQRTAPSTKSSTVRPLPWEPHSISASSHHGWELSPWASGLHPDLFCVYINRMCPKVFTSSLYIILVYKSYHGKALLPGGRRKTSYSKITVFSMLRWASSSLWSAYFTFSFISIIKARSKERRRKVVLQRKLKWNGKGWKIVQETFPK